jgi:hypothetical protein
MVNPTFSVRRGYEQHSSSDCSSGMPLRPSGSRNQTVLEVSDLVSGCRFYFRHHPDVAIVDLRKHGEERGTLSLIRRIGRRPQTA